MSEKIREGRDLLEVGIGFHCSLSDGGWGQARGARRQGQEIGREKQEGGGEDWGARGLLRRRVDETVTAKT